MSVCDMTDGNKTYMIALAFGVLAGVYANGYLTTDQFNTILAGLNGAGFAALRAGVEKNKTEEVVPNEPK